MRGCRGGGAGELPCMAIWHGRLRGWRSAAPSRPARSSAMSARRPQAANRACISVRTNGVPVDPVAEVQANTGTNSAVDQFVGRIIHVEAPAGLTPIRCRRRSGSVSSSDPPGG